MIKDEGRPRDVYCDGWRPKADHLRHEVLLTDFLLRYDDFATITRGYNCDKVIQPDAEMSMGGQKYYIELDTGSVNHTRQRRRWKLYGKVTDEFLLVVTSTPKRMANLIVNSQRVESIALFATLADVLDDPFGAIWRERLSANKVALPCPAYQEVLKNGDEKPGR